MATIKQTAFRFTADDLAILAALRTKLGVLNTTDVVRQAIRALAEKHGVKVGGAKPKRR